MPPIRPEASPIVRAAHADPPAIWARYRDNLARHLIGLARDLQLRLMSHLVVTCGHRGLRPSFGLPITLIAREPRPLSELARALAISPQAASQLVTLAERAGYVARRDAARDRRARIAVLTGAGERLVADAVTYLRALEAEQAERLEADDARRFLAALSALAASLSPDLVPASTGSRGSLGVLPIVAARIEQALMHATSERGHRGLKLSHSQILTLIGPSGARLHQLAELHRVSRQAISATARDLEGLGYLRREGDPSDRRGVVVRLTPRGLKLLEDSVSALDRLDAKIRAATGSEAFEDLARVARTLYGALELETGLLSAAFPEIFPEAAPAALPPATLGASLTVDHGAPYAAHRDARDGALPNRNPSRNPSPNPNADLARLAARLRDRLGARDAARLAVHLASST